MTNPDGQTDDPRRGIPSVSAVLEDPRVKTLIAAHTRSVVVEAIQEALEDLRADVGSAGRPPGLDEVVAAVEDVLRITEQDRIRPIVNATGIILHTGLGRAVLPKQTAEALAQLDRCCNLQVDIETGLRGKRNHRTEELLCKLTGAEAALIVNNNAAATLLVLAALCGGKEVVVSRGQLIEIGGSFRLPDCIHSSGAKLVEVGTTNKTHLRDYEAALTEETGAFLCVNPSNYRIVGFSKAVPVADLVRLKQEKAPGVAVIDDLGCGALVDLEAYGLPHEPTVPESIAAGADVACFSGDKLIGGPQAGIIVGRKDCIARIRKHPLTRMLRVGKLTDAALEHTLRLFLDPETLCETNPTLRMITMPKAAVKKRAQALQRRVARENIPVDVQVTEGESATGGGSLPATPIPTYVLVVRVDGVPPDELNARLRRHEPPVIARVKDDAVVLDMRTLMDGDDKVIVSALKQAAPDVETQTDGD